MLKRNGFTFLSVLVITITTTLLGKSLQKLSQHLYAEGFSMIAHFMSYHDYPPIWCSPLSRPPDPNGLRSVTDDDRRADDQQQGTIAD